MASEVPFPFAYLYSQLSAAAKDEFRDAMRTIKRLPIKMQLKAMQRTLLRLSKRPEWYGR